MLRKESYNLSDSWRIEIDLEELERPKGPYHPSKGEPFDTIKLASWRKKTPTS